MNEKWRDINGYEGLYQVSNYGEVKSMRNKKERILKPGITARGYEQVWLCKNGSKNKRFVHRIVAEAFIDNPNNYKVVNHIDGCKTNNNALNLEWCTQSHNIKHAYDNGLCKNCIAASKQNVYTAITASKKQVRCITTDTIYESASEAAKLTGINNSNICACCRGIYKTAGGCQWEYIK